MPPKWMIARTLRDNIPFEAARFETEDLEQVIATSYDLGIQNTWYFLDLVYDDLRRVAREEMRMHVQNVGDPRQPGKDNHQVDEVREPDEGTDGSNLEIDDPDIDEDDDELPPSDSDDSED